MQEGAESQIAEMALRSAEAALRIAPLVASALGRALAAAARAAAAAVKACAKVASKASGKSGVRALSAEGRDLAVNTVPKKGSRALKRHMSKYGAPFVVFRDPATGQRLAVYRASDAALIGKGLESFASKKAGRAKESMQGAITAAVAAASAKTVAKGPKRPKGLGK